MPVDGPQYPVNLVLRGRSVLVVGGGPVATSKVEGLLDGGADQILVVAPDVTDDLRALADDGIVAIERRPYVRTAPDRHLFRRLPLERMRVDLHPPDVADLVHNRFDIEHRSGGIPLESLDTRSLPASLRAPEEQREPGRDL